MKKALRVLCSLSMVVALVFGVATVAFAGSFPSVTISATDMNYGPGTDTDGTHFDITFRHSDQDGWFVGDTDGGASTITISAKNGEHIKGIEFNASYICNDTQPLSSLSATAGTFAGLGDVTVGAEVDLDFTGDITTVTISWGPEDSYFMQFNSAKIYYVDSVPPTGDNSTAPIWFITFMVAAMGLAGTFVFGKKVR